MRFNLGGAASGAAGGSAAGPWGALAGGVLGGFLGGKGTKDKMKQLPTMTPEQQKMLQGLIQQLGPQGGLGQGNKESIDLYRQLLDPSSEAVSQFTQPYMNEFNQQTIPGLAERFAGAGAMGGGLSSSGFGQSLGAAGGNLQATLAQLKAQLGMQAGQGLMGQYSGMMGQALGAQPFQYSYQPGGMGAGQAAFGGWMNKGMPGMSNLMNQAGDAWGDYGPIMGGGW